MYSGVGLIDQTDGMPLGTLCLNAEFQVDLAQSDYLGRWLQLRFRSQDRGFGSC